MKIYIVDILNFYKKNKLDISCDKQYIYLKKYLFNKFLNANFEDIKFNKYKKPYFENSLYFNISHSKNLLALVTSYYEVGIDIEKIKNFNYDLLKKTNSNEEIKYINRDPIDRFFILWTIKESLVKCVGTGFKNLPNQINIDIDNIEKGYYFNKKIYYSKYFKIENFYMSITSEFIDYINIYEL